MQINKILLSTTFALANALLPSNAMADANDQAIRIHNRLLGVPPMAGDKTFEKMVGLIKKGKAEEAALLLLDKPDFYNITLRNMISPWTNEDLNVHIPLNDYSATVIGMIRDNVPFNELLSTDILYVGDEVKVTAAISADEDEVFAPYNPLNNEHYEQIDSKNLNLFDVLTRTSQVEHNEELANQAAYVPAGIYTTRGFAEAYYSAGTNRAAFRFTLKTFFCEDNEAFHDTNLPDNWIRQDVDRAPAGDPKQFVNKCKGCHTGMDAFTGAFSYVDFVTEEDGSRLRYSRPPAGSSPHVFASNVVSKYFNNSSTFPSGRVTKNDYWLNLWTEGPNARIGWKKTNPDQPLEGYGLKSFGRMITATDQFATCMARKVYRQVCMREPVNPEELEFVKTSGKEFSSKYKYQMKPLFAKSAAFCSGEEAK